MEQEIEALITAIFSHIIYQYEKRAWQLPGPFVYDKELV